MWGQPKNIEAAKESFLWDQTNLEESLSRLFKYVAEEATKSIDWYWRRKSVKARLSRGIQFSAVTLTALAALVPVVGAIWTELQLPALVASLLVGIAAALLALDRAFGFSSGWARYVLAATTIRGKLEEFRMDWTLMRAGLSAGTLTTNELSALVEKAKTFRLAVEEIVMQETKDWVTEFQTNLTQLEKDAKAQIELLKGQVDKAQQAHAIDNQSGAIEITVPNADKTDGFSYAIVLDSDRGTVATDTVSNDMRWGRLGLPAGSYRVLVSAKTQARPISSTTLLDVTGNKITRVEVTLPV